MKRHEKIHKLANAIRDYRGQYDPKTGIWKYPPQPKAADRVARWLRELTPDATEGMKDVDGFKTFDEFRKWIGTL